jgi:hypothetical protein
MAFQQPIELCKVCQKRTFSKSQGIICSLTSEKPSFTDSCSDYLADEDQKKRENRFKASHSPKEVRKEAAIKMLSGGLPLLAIGLFLTFFPMPYIVGIVGLVCLLLGLVFSAYGFARFVVHDSEPSSPKAVHKDDESDLEVF